MKCSCDNHIQVLQELYRVFHLPSQQKIPMVSRIKSVGVAKDPHGNGKVGRLMRDYYFLRPSIEFGVLIDVNGPLVRRRLPNMADDGLGDVGLLQGSDKESCLIAIRF